MLFINMVLAAADPELGGALDLQTAAYIPDSGPIQSGAGWQAEGDLSFNPGGFRFTLELDFGGGLGTIFPESLLFLAPERASVQVGAKGWWFEGGFLPPPWGMEATDSWRNPLISWSLLRRPGAGSIQGIFGPDGLVPLGTLIGGGFGYTEREGGVVALAGLDLPGGMNLLGEPLEDVRNSTLLVGGQGFYVGQNILFKGGFYGHPIDDGPLTLDAGVQIRPELLWVTVEGAATFTGQYGLMAQGEFLPRGQASPVLRLEMTNLGFGGSLGLCGDFWEFVRLKLEARYSEQTPSLWAEATLYTPKTRAAPGRVDTNW
jgi:hypothetical protein